MRTDESRAGTNRASERRDSRVKIDGASGLTSDATLSPFEATMLEGIKSNVAFRTRDLTTWIGDANPKTVEAACWRMYRANLIDNIHGFWCVPTEGAITSEHRLVSTILSHLGKAAIGYARQGVPVFSLQPGTKEPFSNSNGFKDATTDTDQIVKWWTDSPDANIGARCGVVFDVLDIDVKIAADGHVIKDGRPAMHILNANAMLKGLLGIAMTRHNGTHIFYPPSGLGVKHLHDRHIDFQAAGSYVVMPPSIVPADEGIKGSGRYEWRGLLDLSQDNAHPFDWERANKLLYPRPEDAVPGLKDFLTKFSAPRSGEINTLAHWLAKQPEGNRNNALFWAACRAFENGYDPEELRESAKRIGLAKDAITRTINSARKMARKGKVA